MVRVMIWVSLQMLCVRVLSFPRWCSNQFGVVDIVIIGSRVIIIACAGLLLVGCCWWGCRLLVVFEAVSVERVGVMVVKGGCVISADTIVIAVVVIS